MFTLLFFAHFDYFVEKMIFAKHISRLAQLFHIFTKYSFLNLEMIHIYYFCSDGFLTCKKQISTSNIECVSNSLYASEKYLLLMKTSFQSFFSFEDLIINKINTVVLFYYIPKCLVKQRSFVFKL